MKIVAGLGNPGPKFETTRHNAGFLAIDWLVDAWNARSQPHAFDAELWQASVGGEKVLLAKPQTFMNNSGRAIAPLAKFYKCAVEDVIVIHDEADLPPRAIRIKTGGGTAGHNGLRSLDAHFGAGQTGYHRIRIGVGKPGQLGVETAIRDTADYLLSPFSDIELAELDDVFKRIGPAAERIIRGDITGAMNEFNRSPGEPNTNKQER